MIPNTVSNWRITCSLAPGGSSSMPLSISNIPTILSKSDIADLSSSAFSDKFSPICLTPFCTKEPTVSLNLPLSLLRTLSLARKPACSKVRNFNASGKPVFLMILSYESLDKLRDCSPMSTALRSIKNWLYCSSKDFI